MAIQPIRLFGDPVLRVPAEPVRDFDRELHTLVRDLTDTMVDAPGVGLAARSSASACASSPITSMTSSGTSSTPSSTCPRRSRRTTRAACPFPAWRSRADAHYV